MRTALARVLVVLLAVSAGCTGFEFGPTIDRLPNDGPASTPTPTPTPTPEPTVTFFDTPTRTPGSIDSDPPVAGGGAIEIRVGGPGDWSGTIAYRGLSRRVSGMDYRRIAIPSGTDTLTVTVRKDTEGSYPVVIEVYVDNRLVRQESTQSEYGQIRTTVSFG